MDPTIVKRLRQIYYEPSNPGSFGGSHRLYLAAKPQIPKLSLKKVKEFLSGEYPYSLHRNVRKNFPRNKIYVSRPDQCWQVDLVDLQKLAAHNYGFKHLLVAIDCLTRYAWVRPLRAKTGSAITKAFKSILDEGREPETVQSDRGTEFENLTFKNFLKRRDIHFFTTRNFTVKAAIAERFNRTLKARMYRFFAFSNLPRYIDILQDIVAAYNNSIHRSIGMRPSKVTSKEIPQILKRLYGSSDIQFKIQKKPKLKRGDLVRRQLKRATFRRGYEVNWSDQLFIVDNIINKPIPLYEIRDEKKRKIPQRYHEHELQKVNITDDARFRIERILDERWRDGEKEVLIKWAGYPMEFCEWLPASNIESITL